jgi:hypothetical protein
MIKSLNIWAVDFDNVLGCCTVASDRVVCCGPMNPNN